MRGKETISARSDVSRPVMRTLVPESVSSMNAHVYGKSTDILQHLKRIHTPLPLPLPISSSSSESDSDTDSLSPSVEEANPRKGVLLYNLLRSATDEAGE